jgi:Transglycosylase SLT domain/D-alanyl-D-alanine carboxypeptidase
MRAERFGGQRGSVTVLLVGGLAGLLVGVLVIGAVARAVGREGAARCAADLAALAGARAMEAAYDRLFEPAVFADAPNPLHLERDSYLAVGRRAAEVTAARNGVREVVVSFPDGSSFAPMRIRVAVRERIEVTRGDAHRSVRVRAVAVAELAPPGGVAGFASGGGYDGPLAYRQGKPMRPDVAQWFDRMAVAARADGVALLITSAFRSDAEQAVLFARQPDPKWVAPPGHSLHRNATELDLGPASAYAWLAANASRFHFMQRYEWEKWHYGFVLNPRSSPRPTAGASSSAGGGSRIPGTDGGDGERAGAGTGALPAFVPPRFAGMLARAAQRWNVSATLLAAQLYAESNFNPFAVSPAGAQGIAQFMPGTAHGLELANPFDAEEAIDAQAHLMRDLLRRFGAVPLALAAYNAGPGAVAGCGCVPPYPETRAYVARILGLMGGAGEVVAGAAGGLVVRLVA